MKVWQDDQPLVWYHDDGPLVNGRHCVMRSGMTIYARFTTKAEAEAVIAAIGDIGKRKNPRAPRGRSGA